MKSFVLAALAALAIGSTATAETVKVGVASEPYPPFTSPDASGKWSGWEIDIMNAVCKAENMDCKVTPVAWDGIIPSLTSGQIDAIMSSMSITAEREKSIDFSDKYYNTPTIVIAPKGSDLKPTDASLKGKILGVQVSTIHQAYAQAHFPDAQIKTYQTQDEANQDLVAGRVDAVQADSIALDAFLKSDAGSCCESIGAVPDDPTILGKGVGVGVRKGDDALKAKFNAGIKKIREDGEYEKISKPYFSSSIYGK